MVEIEERMCGLTVEKERRAAVECQLRFRKNVLKCKNENGCLNMSERGKKFSVDRMIENLKTVVRGVNVERQVVNERIVYSEHVSEDVMNERKVFLSGIECEDEGARSVKKVATERVPRVRCAEDLIGKRACVLTERGDWRKFTVVGGSMTENVMRECKFVHKVRYDGSASECEVYLMDDLRLGAVRVISLNVSDLLNERIEHLCKDEESGNESWWKARVVKVLNERRKDPMFVVVYEGEDDDECEWEFNLYEDYVNGDLRLL